MTENSADGFLPQERSLTSLAEAVQSCQGCDLYLNAIHRKPDLREQLACRPWLDAELEQVRPTVLVCLGATAAQALLGRSFRVTQDRGRFVESPLAPFVMATVHPSSILRTPDDARDEAMRAFVADLRKVSKTLERAA